MADFSGHLSPFIYNDWEVEYEKRTGGINMNNTKQNAIEFVENWKQNAIEAVGENWKQAITFDSDAPATGNLVCKRVPDYRNEKKLVPSLIVQAPETIQRQEEKNLAVEFPLGGKDDLVQHLWAYVLANNISEEKYQKLFAEILGIKQEQCEPINRDSYIFKADILYLKKSGSNNLERVANFELIIEKEAEKIEREDEDGVSFSKFYFLGKIKHKDQLYNFEVACEEVTQFKWIQKVSKGKGYIYDRNLFLGYLESLVLKEYPKIKVFMTNGWKKIDSGRWGYVIDSGVIGFGNINIYGDRRHRFITDVHLKERKRNFELFLEMSQITKEPDKIVPLMLFTCVGSLTKLFSLADFPVKFCMGYFGVTNSKKTSISLAVTKIFNRDTNEGPEVSFYSTEGGIEVAMSTFSDAVLLVDDKRPCESRSERLVQNKKYENILRSYGDRTAKKRMTAFCNTSNVFYPPSGVCLITGEVDSGVASTKSRIIIIETDSEQCRNQKLLYFQQNKYILTNFLHNFISYITDNFTAIVEDIKKNCRNVRDQYSSDFKIARYAEYYAIFHEIIAILEMYGNHVGLDYKFKTEYDAIMLNLLKCNDANLNKLDPGLIFLEAIDNVCNLDPEKLRYVKNGQKLNNVKSTDIFIGDDEIFLKLDYAYSITLKYCKNLGKEFPLENSKQIIPFLKNLNVIKTEKSRNTIKRTAFVDSQDRFLVLRKNELKNIIQN